MRQVLPLVASIAVGVLGSWLGLSLIGTLFMAGCAALAVWGSTGEAREETSEAKRHRIKAAIHSGLNEMDCHLSDDEYDHAFRRIYRGILQGRLKVTIMVGGKLVSWKLPAGFAADRESASNGRPEKAIVDEGESWAVRQVKRLLK